MGNAAMFGVAAGESGGTGRMLASEAVRALKEDVQRQMKTLKAEGRLAGGDPTRVATSRGVFNMPATDDGAAVTADSNDVVESKSGPAPAQVGNSAGRASAAGAAERKQQAATQTDAEEQQPEQSNQQQGPQGGATASAAAGKEGKTTADFNKGGSSAEEEVTGGGSGGEGSPAAVARAAAMSEVSIAVPRNLAKILGALEARVAGLEATIQDMHTAQVLGDEAIACVLRANPRRGDAGVPYFVFDALDVAVDDDPFPALRQRPVQVLRVRNFVMQEDRTARLVAALKAPCARALCELHFLNCEWDLVQAADVADAWRDAGLHVSVLNFSGSQKLRGDTLAGFFTHPLSHLRTLDLEYCQHVDDTSVEALAAQCRGLRVVNFNRCFKLTDKSAKALVTANPQLHDARLAQTSISDEGLRALAAAGPHLRRLEMAGCKDVTNAGLEAVGAACPGLIQVDVSGCGKVSTAGVAALARGCPGLLHVHMAKLYLVKDAAIKALAESCHQLMTLDVSKCSLLGDQCLVSLARGCPYLRELQMNECRQISDGAVGALSEGCEFLRNFSLRKCARLTDAAVLSFAESSRRLETLDLAGCEKITDAGIEALVKGCDQLRSVDCTACYVSDEALRSIGYHCPRLQSLRIAASDYVTDWGMGYISDGFRRCSFLVRVDFSDCPQITDKGLTALCNGVGAHIEHLNLDGCTGLTNAGMFAVAKSMAHLQNLRIGRIPAVTANALTQLAKGCLFLEELFLEDCVGVTKLLPILNFSAALRTVMVCGITGATDLDSLIAACAEDRGDGQKGRTELQVVHWREAKGVIRFKML